MIQGKVISSNEQHNSQKSPHRDWLNSGHHKLTVPADLRELPDLYSANVPVTYNFDIDPWEDVRMGVMCSFNITFNQLLMFNGLIQEVIKECISLLSNIWKHGKFVAFFYFFIVMAQTWMVSFTHTAQHFLYKNKYFVWESVNEKHIVKCFID